MKFKVELRYSYRWDDACWIDEIEDGIKPTRFETVTEAETALEEFFVDVRTAVAAGDMDSECDRCDVRIVKAND